MTPFRSNTHREIWRQRWCYTCFQPDEAARRIQHKDTVCPIWAKAMRTGLEPVEWDRTRSDEMEKSIKCNAYEPRPATVKRDKQFDDVPMFDVTPYAVDVGFVPVENWPDRPTKDGVDHA